MTVDEFDSLQRGDVVVWDADGALGLVTRRGTKIVAVLWEGAVTTRPEDARDAPDMTIVSRASSKAGA